MKNKIALAAGAIGIIGLLYAGLQYKKTQPAKKATKPPAHKESISCAVIHGTPEEMAKPETAEEEKHPHTLALLFPYYLKEQLCQLHSSNDGSDEATTILREYAWFWHGHTHEFKEPSLITPVTEPDQLYCLVRLDFKTPFRKVKFPLCSIVVDLILEEWNLFETSKASYSVSNVVFGINSIELLNNGFYMATHK